MATVGSPYQNAKPESSFRTLMTEDVYVKAYRNFEEAKESVGAFTAEVYNLKCLHSGPGGLPPLGFETIHALQSES